MKISDSETFKKALRRFVENEREWVGECTGFEELDGDWDLAIQACSPWRIEVGIHKTNSGKLLKLDLGQAFCHSEINDIATSEEMVELLMKHSDIDPDTKVCFFNADCVRWG